MLLTAARQAQKFYFFKKSIVSNITDLQLKVRAFADRAAVDDTSIPLWGHFTATGTSACEPVDDLVL